MLRYLLFTILLLTFIFSAAAQEKIWFKASYLPNSTYQRNVKNITTNTITYSGPGEFLQALSDKGLENPTITEITLHNETIFRTREMDPEEVFPVEVEFIKMLQNDSAIIPAGTVIYGNCKKGGRPTYDSIASEGLSEDIKAELLKVMGSLLSQIEIEPVEMEVGDSIVLENPISIPVATIKLDMVIHTTYKLISLRKDIATFDIDQNYTAAMDISDYPLTGSGTGKGKLLYDAKTFINKSYELQTQTEMVLDMKEFEVFINSKHSSVSKTIYTKN